MVTADPAVLAARMVLSLSTLPLLAALAAAEASEVVKLASAVLPVTVAGDRKFGAAIL